MGCFFEWVCMEEGERRAYAELVEHFDFFSVIVKAKINALTAQLGQKVQFSKLRNLEIQPRLLFSSSSSESSNSAITKALNICLPTMIASKKNFQKQRNRKQ